MLPALLRYSIAWIRYPQFADFIDAGLGIEARANRAKNFWAPHLTLAKSFQRRTIGPGDTVAILGAGRLLDVDIEFLAGNFKRIILVDADPGVLSTWKRMARLYSGKVSFDFQIADVTGSLSTWTRLLRSNPSLEQLEGFRVSEFKLPKAEVLISLNLLSQIPIYWRDRAVAIIKRFHKLELNQEEKLPLQWELALQRTMTLLEEGHLEALGNSVADTVVIVSDILFHYYERDRSHWQTEEALRLNSVELGPRYRLAEEDRWLWHIAPQGNEFPDYGIFHEVLALKFVTAQ